MSASRSVDHTDPQVTKCRMHFAQRQAFSTDPLPLLSVQVGPSLIEGIDEFLGLVDVGHCRQQPDGIGRDRRIFKAPSLLLQNLFGVCDAFLDRR